MRKPTSAFYALIEYDPDAAWALLLPLGFTPIDLIMCSKLPDVCAEDYENTIGATKLLESYLNSDSADITFPTAYSKYPRALFIHGIARMIQKCDNFEARARQFEYVMREPYNDYKGLIRDAVIVCTQCEHLCSDEKIRSLKLLTKYL